MSSPYSARTPIQAAMYARMTGDELLMSMVAGVYDDVPEDVTFPYVEFGGSIETTDNAHGQHGRVTVQTLDVWSEYPGWGEVNAISWRLAELFDEQPLDVVGCRYVACRHEFSQNMKDPDRPRLRRVTTRYRINTERE